ncbi:Uncharacterised protein [uncultured archaeon]|nr:Uncharacterised protein [uncultured archaeon]
MKLKPFILRFICILAAVLVFTFFDWIVHSSFEALAVPSWYFRNKIIYGTIIAFVASLVFRKVSIPKQAALITIFTVGLLQIRYALYGYPWWFHVIVLTEHAIFLFITSFVALKILSRLAKHL